MRTKLTLDKRGRIVLPKSLRDQMQLSPGDTLQLERKGECVTLRPVRPKVMLKKECGIWVYQVVSPDASIPEPLDRDNLKSLLLRPAAPRFEDLARKRGKLRCRQPVDLT